MAKSGKYDYQNKEHEGTISEYGWLKKPNKSAPQKAKIKLAKINKNHHFGNLPKAYTIMRSFYAWKNYWISRKGGNQWCALGPVLIPFPPTLNRFCQAEVGYGDGSFFSACIMGVSEEKEKNLYVHLSYVLCPIPLILLYT